MDNFSPSKGLLDLTKVILARIFSEDKCNQLTDEQLEILSNIVLHHLIKLETRQRTVLTKRYGIGGGDSETFITIGDSLGVTRERVRQIELKAIYRLERAARPYLIKAMFNIESEEASTK